MRPEPASNECVYLDECPGASVVHRPYPESSGKVLCVCECVFARVTQNVLPLLCSLYPRHIYDILFRFVCAYL